MGPGGGERKLSPFFASIFPLFPPETPDIQATASQKLLTGVKLSQQRRLMSYMYVTNELNIDKNLTNPKRLNLRLPITLGLNMVISFKPLDYWLYVEASC